jgi:hypothetical protein
VGRHLRRAGPAAVRVDGRLHHRELTSDLLDLFLPGATVRSELANHESVIDTRLAGTVLGFSAKYGWRQNSGGAS